MNYASKAAGLAIKMIRRHQSHDCVERNLFAQVLCTAVNDAVSRSCRLRESAREYFTSGKHQIHCRAAGIHPEFFRDILSKVIDYADQVPADGELHKPMPVLERRQVGRPRIHPVKQRRSRRGRPSNAELAAAA